MIRKPSFLTAASAYMLGLFFIHGYFDKSNLLHGKVSTLFFILLFFAGGIYESLRLKAAAAAKYLAEAEADFKAGRNTPGAVAYASAVMYSQLHGVPFNIKNQTPLTRWDD